MAWVIRKVVKTCNITAFLTSFVIVTTFIYLREKRTATGQSEQLPMVGHTDQSNYIRDTRRSLLKYTFYHRKKPVDTLWNAELKFQSWRQLSNKQLQVRMAETSTETTPLMTDRATKPITTQSDTTPLFTESPTSPITTQSITTPLVTEPGAKEVTTDQEKILLL